MIVGIDPGLTGALALVDEDQGYRLVGVLDVEAADGRIVVAPLVRWLTEWQPNLAVVEAVRSRPHQGVASTFKFGRAYGCLEGVVEALGFPCWEITPTVWKRRMGVTADKASARAEACRLWPDRADWFARVRDAGRAEAALLAVAWMRHPGRRDNERV